MIRRPPTLLKMTDLDVQDVRALVNHQKGLVEHQKMLLARITPRLADPNFTEADQDLATYFYNAEKAALGEWRLHSSQFPDNEV